MAKTKIATANISLDTIMPNGKSLGHCTFAEVKNFKIGDLTKIAGMSFWLAMLHGAE
jgi:hypothetical protein